MLHFTTFRKLFPEKGPESGNDNRKKAMVARVGKRAQAQSCKSVNCKKLSIRVERRIAWFFLNKNEV